MKPGLPTRSRQGGSALRSGSGPLSVASTSSVRPSVIPETDEWNGKVASQFSDSFEYWDSIYSSPKVKAQVYRNRMAIATRWATRVAGRGATAADVGTGAGHVAVVLAKHGIRVAAIDASEAMLAQVAQNASRAGVADFVDPMASDAQRLDLPSATRDVVVALGLLPWVKRPDIALSEMARITKPGGHVIVTMDNALSLTRGLDPIWYASIRGLIRTIRRFFRGSASVAPPAYPSATTPRDLDRLIRTVGLNPLEFSGVGFGPFTFLGRSVLPNRIELRLERLLQGLADKNVPLIRHAAVFHVALAMKPIQEPASICHRAGQAGS